MSRNIKISQIDGEEQLLVRLAWACEVEGLTQSEAAERFGITRLRVNKSLSEARRRGILRVSIESVYTAAADLEWQLERHFRLMRVCVVPSPENVEEVTTLVSAGPHILGTHNARVRNYFQRYLQTLGDNSKQIGGVLLRR